MSTKMVSKTTMQGTMWMQQIGGGLQLQGDNPQQVRGEEENHRSHQGIVQIWKIMVPRVAQKVASRQSKKDQQKGKARRAKMPRSKPWIHPFHLK